MIALKQQHLAGNNNCDGSLSHSRLNSHVGAAVKICNKYSITSNQHRIFATKIQIAHSSKYRNAHAEVGTL